MFLRRRRRRRLRRSNCRLTGNSRGGSAVRPFRLHNGRALPLNSKGRLCRWLTCDTGGGWRYARCHIMLTTDTAVKLADDAPVFALETALAIATARRGVRDTQVTSPAISNRQF